MQRKKKLMSNNKFTKKELERLNCTQDEIDLVLKCQKTLPIIFDNKAIDKFCVDARTLHKELSVSKKFATWIKSNIKDYDENVDYIISPPRVTDNKTSKFQPKEEFLLTINFAKEIAMYTGKNSQASNELKKISREVRKYFILMEEIVQRNKEWLEVRDPEIQEYKNMSAQVDAWCFRIWHHHASRSEFAIEADMMNQIVMGKTSRELKLELGISTNDLLRDYLKKDHNEELLFLERNNQTLLLMDMGFTERKNMLTKMHEVTFKNKVTNKAS